MQVAKTKYFCKNGYFMGLGNTPLGGEVRGGGYGGVNPKNTPKNKNAFSDAFLDASETAIFFDRQNFARAVEHFLRHGKGGKKSLVSVPYAIFCVTDRMP